MNANRKAFLDMLAVSEGTSTSKRTKCDGYDIIVVGMDGVWELITDFSTHPFANGRPSKVFNKAGQVSSASGRYQFLKKDWTHYRDTLGLPDFGPESQDKWALQLIKECGALPDIDAGNFKSAVYKCRKIWASLPGAGYGQHENTIEKLTNAYVKAGGQFVESATEAVTEAIQTTPAKAPSILTLIMTVLKFFTNFVKKP
jgi:muramidase (phage lysozyme)